MPKKNFKDNPALQFLSTADPAEPAQETAPQYPMKRNPLYVETKSRRLQLVVQPSLHERLKNRAKARGLSVNEYVHQILDEATREE